MTGMALELPRELWADVIAHLRSELPCEACGFLAGRADRAQFTFPVANALKSPIAYRMEPRAQLQAMLAIERQDLEIVAIYHSHPKGPPLPSVTDLAEAAYPDTRYLICAPGPDNTIWDGRAFWLRAGQAVEEPIVWTPTATTRSGIANSQ